MDRRIFLAAVSGISAGTFLNAVAGDSEEVKWGNLNGRFIYDGEPRERTKLEVTKDTAFVKEPLFDESLLVDPKNRGVSNVMVRLVAERSGKLPVHPSLDEASRNPVNAAIEGLVFRPHVIVVRTGQTLVLKMPDLVGHNPNWHAPRNPEIGKMINSSKKMTRVFNHLEPEPIQVSCSVHPWESAILVVTDHPYVALSQADGSFAIKNVPVGTWDFQLWHERARWLKRITIGGKRRDLVDGKLRIKIKPGENDLGEIRIEPKLLEWKR
jgi:hypothetical protein